jgi:acyl carrier protein
MVMIAQEARQVGGPTRWQEPTMDDREILKETLQALLEEEMGEPFELADDGIDLRTELGLDSVDVVGLVMRVERQFRIRLGMEELMEVKQVGQLLDLIQAKIAERPSSAAA